MAEPRARIKIQVAISAPSMILLDGTATYSYKGKDSPATIVTQFVTDGQAGFVLSLPNDAASDTILNVGTSAEGVLFKYVGEVEYGSRAKGSSFVKRTGGMGISCQFVRN
jgi:hypothetical protein